MLHAVEPEIAGEPAATLLAPVDLHLPALVLPLAPADDVPALAVGAGDPVVSTLLLPLDGVLLHIVFQLEGELHRVDVLADHVAGRVVRARAGPDPPFVLEVFAGHEVLAVAGLGFHHPVILSHFTHGIGLRQDRKAAEFTGVLELVHRGSTSYC